VADHITKGLKRGRNSAGGTVAAAAEAGDDHGSSSGGEGGADMTPNASRTELADMIRKNGEEIATSVEMVVEKVRGVGRVGVRDAVSLCAQGLFHVQAMHVRARGGYVCIAVFHAHWLGLCMEEGAGGAGECACGGKGRKFSRMGLLESLCVVHKRHAAAHLTTTLAAMPWMHINFLVLLLLPAAAAAVLSTDHAWGVRQGGGQCR
jgi:hypothetical protein